LTAAGISPHEATRAQGEFVGVDGRDTAAMGFIAPSLVVEWGVTKAALAPVMGAALFGLAIGALTTGRLADKYGRKKAIVASGLIFGIASPLASPCRRPKN
jgi:MFS transporter, AAHS family, 4-hydroxybenzoate transporter